VGTAAAKKAREDGCPSAMKMIMWQHPTERDWEAALRWLCKNRHVQVAALFLVARRAAQRGHDVKRLCLGDIMWRQAGSEAKGTAIPYLALTPDGPKMMQVFRWCLRYHAESAICLWVGCMHASNPTCTHLWPPPDINRGDRRASTSSTVLHGTANSASVRSS